MFVFWVFLRKNTIFRLINKIKCSFFWTVANFGFLFFAGTGACLIFVFLNLLSRRMRLNRISILNYKNIEQSDLDFSANVNCLVGKNGMGKTNLLDAIFYLSFCKSASGGLDSSNIFHGADFFMIQGFYENDDNTSTQVSCGVQNGKRKRIKCNDKDCKKISEHVGRIPLVMISPADSLLVTGGSDERRKFMDSVISQYAPQYLNALIRYERALKQRNALLKSEEEPDWGIMDILEDMMDDCAAVIFRERRGFLDTFLPVFQSLYAHLCDVSCENVSIEYVSHGFRGGLKQQLQEGRQKERIVGYTLHGIHKDDLLLSFNGYPLRQEGSQGQTKTYFIALKLAQFLYLKEKGERRTPILLLDDIFDKLDAGRVARIVEYVSGTDFGQIFITDTNREHTDQILAATAKDYRLFTVNNGNIECTYGTKTI